MKKTNINNIIFLLFVFSIGFNTYLIKKRIISINELNELKMVIQMNRIDSDDKINDLMSHDKLEFASNNKIISQTIHLTNNEGEKLLLKEIVVNPTLIIYWNSICCSECYTDFLNIIRSYGYEKKSINIVVIGEFNSNREFLMFLNSQNISFDSYLLNEPNELNIPLKGGEYPFAFIVNSDYKISNIFTIRKTSSENYQFFLNEMIKQAQIIE